MCRKGAPRMGKGRRGGGRRAAARSAARRTSRIPRAQASHQRVDIGRALVGALSKMVGGAPGVELTSSWPMSWI